MSPEIWVIPTERADSLNLPWGWRGTARGFALVNCELSDQTEVGAVLLDWKNDKVHRWAGKVMMSGTPEDYQILFDHYTRYRITNYNIGEDTEFSFVHQCGPLIVERTLTHTARRVRYVGTNRPRMGLACACGWTGNKRQYNQRRHMVRDQGRHVCPHTNTDKMKETTT